MNPTLSNLINITKKDGNNGNGKANLVIDPKKRDNIESKMIKIKNRRFVDFKSAEGRFREYYPQGIFLPHPDGGIVAIEEEDMLFLVKMLLLKKSVFISGKTGKAKTRIMQSLLHSLPYISKRWELPEINQVIRIRIPLVTQALHLLDGQRILQEKNGTTVTAWQKSEVRKAIEQYGYTDYQEYLTQEKSNNNKRLVVLYGDEIDRLRPQVIDGLLQIISANVMEYNGNIFYYDFASIFTGNYIASLAVEGYEGVNELDQAFLRRMGSIFEPKQNQDFEIALVKSLYPEVDNEIVEKLFKLMELIDKARNNGELRNIREISVYNLMQCIDVMDFGIDVEKAVEYTLASGIYRECEQYSVLKSKIDGIFAKNVYESKAKMSSTLW